MSATTTSVTVDEFFTPGAFPREAELIHGDVVVIDPTFEHQRVARRILVALVTELWLVDTTAKTMVNRRTTPDRSTFDVTLEIPTDQTLTTTLLEGFELDLTALFA